ncbi:Sestrin-3 [Acipenser ruthenus]|uniref:Sestrin-3 n=1 Tax=Acipenser ruthenus TaxID=7906 RepID=A0A444UBS8_ACIRT|nr:Sestrin-3 [Acipenser ruthenus]
MFCDKPTAAEKQSCCPSPAVATTMNVNPESIGSSNSYQICNNCQKVLRKKEKGMRIPRPLTSGPSAFIPEKEILEATPVDMHTNLLLLVGDYSSSGQLNHLTQVMGLHPQYLESFLRCQFYLLRIDGPLPQHYRHYIAIMAAARHQCSFLVNMHVHEFLQIGMCLEWLNGLDFAPQRLRNLNEINKILAHRPWLITKEHIQKLVKTGENSWSLAELVHAVVLLAHFHALASFVFGSGINPEVDADASNRFQDVALNNFCVCDLANDNNLEEFLLPGMVDSVSELEALMGRMKRLQEEEEEASQEEMATRFEKEKEESLLVASGAVMGRMKRLQEEEEEASQEEMATRFEKEKEESLLVASGGTVTCKTFA